MKILVVDDSRINRMAITKTAELYGEVEQARDGVEAVDIFKAALDAESPFELICLDYKMPIMDGHETLVKLRAMEEEAGLRKQAVVIMVTSTTDRASVMKIHKMCQAYIVKPFSSVKLKEKLNAFGFSTKPRHQDDEPLPVEPPTIKARREALFTEEKKTDSSLFIVEKNGTVCFQKKAEDTFPEEFVDLAFEDIDEFKKIKSGDVIARLKGGLEITAGDGVFFLSGKGVFIARKSGKVVFENNTISVLDEMVFDRNLRHESIDFCGKITVNGNIQDGVTVKAGEGVTVKGSVGACSIEAGSDVSIERIDGKNKGLIKCGRNFNTGHIYDAIVECEGNITVSGESVNSVLKSKQEVSLRTVLGGETMAVKSITAEKAGSPKDIRTVFRAGIDFSHYDRVLELKKRLNEIDEEVAQLDHMLGEYSTDPAKAMNLPEEKRDKILEMAGQRLKAEFVEKENLQHELSEIMRQISTADSRIEIRNTAFKGVVFEIGDKQEVLHDTIEGSYAFIPED